MSKTSKNHRNSTVTPNEIIIYEKLSEKSNLSIYAIFMHVQPTYTHCISENMIMAFKMLNMEFAYEPLVHMDFI